MRLFKQFIYGLIFVAAIFLVIWLIYLKILKPMPTCFDNIKNDSETGIDCGGSCISCEIKNIKPFLVTSAILFGDGEIFSVSAEIGNPNYNLAAKSFDYNVIFYDASKNPLEILRRGSFIYAGETKNIIEAAVKITKGIPVNAEIKINKDSIIWEKAENFAPPPYKLDGVSAVLGIDQVKLSGIITNINNFSFSKIIISAFAIDFSGNKINVSKTELRDVARFGVREFEISIPIKKNLIKTIDSAATSKVFVEVLR